MDFGKKVFLKNRKCPYCGNNPVPHRLNWYHESLNIWLTPLRQRLLYNAFTLFFKKNGWDQKLSRIFLSLGEALKIIRRQKDISLCKVPRAKVLWQEAEKRGIKMEELLLFGRPFDAYIASTKESRIKNQESKKDKISNHKFKTIIFSGLPRPVGYSNNWLDLMDDKWIFKKLMIDNALPVPVGGSCSNFNQAKNIFSKIQECSVPIYGHPRPPMNRHATWPIITKPRSGSRGRHSTTFVSSDEDLKKAFKVAQQLCHWVVVEEQLFGPVYRATLVNFELCGVLRGDPPQVLGDGKSSVAGLIKQKNQAPHEGVENIKIDGGMELFLHRQNLNLSSVPPLGKLINLSEKIGVRYGGSSSEDFEVCHADNKELFVKAAKVLGDPIVGFDFIIQDISKSWKEQKCGFLEVNSLPFINLHHDPLLGKPRNVAAKVWDMVNF